MVPFPSFITIAFAVILVEVALTSIFFIIGAIFPACPIYSIFASLGSSLFGINSISNIYPDFVVTSYVPFPLSTISVSLSSIISNSSIYLKYLSGSNFPNPSIIFGAFAVSNLSCHFAISAFSFTSAARLNIPLSPIT